MTPKIPSTALYANQIETPPRLNGSLPNTAFTISLIAFVLGALFGSNLVSSVSAISAELNEFILRLGPSPQLSLYIAVLCWFHLWEFLSTAGWNTTKTSVDSYLLNNGYSYIAAHSFGISSHLALQWLYPSLSSNRWSILAGFVMVILGQTLRTFAMIHASDSFSHHVASFKQKDHKLVTSGVYRHPSYLGFFLWALGTQMILTNPISFIAFASILSRFFIERIKHEEIHLVKFFGDDYRAYKKDVYSFLPYII